MTESTTGSGDQTGAPDFDSMTDDELRQQLTYRGISAPQTSRQSMLDALTGATGATGGQQEQESSVADPVGTMPGDTGGPTSTGRNTSDED
jgi:hypothetical protein